MNNGERLIVVSNRLPVTIEARPEGIHVQPSSGGLVSALLPLFQAQGGTWVGWPGSDEHEEVARILRSECAPEYSLEPVFLTAAEKESFYQGCSNEILWPLFHDLPSRCRFEPSYWAAYREVTEKYADVVERLIRHRRSMVWIHDYHLMMLADALRERGIRATLNYFHHVPFPAPEMFGRLPWRTEVLRGLLRFNTLAFQTERDRRNFVACVRRLLPGARVHRIDSGYLVRVQDLCAMVVAAPVGIDYERFSQEAAAPAAQEKLQELRSGLNGFQLMLGVDRLDYTKGIVERLRGYRCLLQERTDLHGRVALIQVVVPSRENIASYRNLRTDIEREVSAINGEFGQPGWTPVRYLHRSLSPAELLAFYQLADVALVTPLRDGMNLVAKEFCAARNDERGVLVLSEFAGAAAELKVGALLVNPHDVEGLASAMERGLAMSPAEQRARMMRMREVTACNDVFRWCGSVCGKMGRNTHRPAAPLINSRSSLAAVV